MYCNDTKYVNIVSSRLNSLVVRESHYDIDLSSFMNCKNLAALFLTTNNPISAERSKLEKLLLSLPMLEVLTLSSFFLELLSAGAGPQELPFTLNCLWHLILGLNFGQMGQLSCALELIKRSPNLSKLEIWVRMANVNTTSVTVEAASEYLDRADCLNQPLNKLKYVVIHFF